MSFFKQLFSSIPKISATETGEKLQSNPKPFLLDVRQPQEYYGGHIPGARLIPLQNLNDRLEKLPRDQEIICVCRSGNRSRSATKQLLKAGFQARNMKGGMLAWNRRGYKVKQGKKP